MVESIGETVQNYIKSIPSEWKKKGWFRRILDIVIYLILLPFMIEYAVVVTIISPLIIFGFLYRFLKHNAVIAWLILVLFLNIASVADLVADITMFVKYGIPIIWNQYSSDHKEEEFSEDPVEDKLIGWRLILTTITAIPGLIVLIYFVRGEKKTTMAGGSFGAILALICWKIVLIFVRLWIMFKLIYTFIKFRKLDEVTENIIQRAELFAILDVIWSAIPLGVLTLLEMFYYEEEIHFTISTSIEMVKLIALAIDLIGIVYLVYFEIFGLEHKIFGHHHENGKHINHESNSEKESLIKKTNTNKKTIKNTNTNNKNPNNNKNTNNKSNNV